MKTFRKVLLVGMPDSIHLAKWMDRFDKSTVQFTIFPSKKYRTIHPDIARHLNEGVLLYRRVRFFSTGLSGYLDFLLHEVMAKVLPSLSRTAALKRLLSNQFDYLHAHELQGAGYLCSEVSHLTSAEFILSIWGSDLTYFAELDDHREKVIKSLSVANSLSAECIRDYKIAKRLGFHGLELPLIPVSASFSFSDSEQPYIPANERNLIVVKTYGKPFGRGDLAIQAVEIFLQNNSQPEVFFYSVGAELVRKVEILANKFPGRISFTIAKKPIPQLELYSYFKRARIYLGVSESDGISTSFLEAISFGAYPIQTNTSCANEWESMGVNCSLIEVDENSIVAALSENYFKTEKLIESQEINYSIAKDKLDNTYIATVAHEFYFRV